MKLGLIARMDDSGLGIQTWEAYRHLKPHKTLAIDYSNFGELKQHPERFPDAQKVVSIPNPTEVNKFLNDIDIVFSCETPYSYKMLELAKFKGIKTVIQTNYEFFRWIKHSTFPRPDLFALPSKWHEKDIPFENKYLLPVPIALDLFKGMTDKPEVATNFLHIVGKPAANDRNGTDILLKALQFVKSDITMTLRSYKPNYLNDLAQKYNIPSNVNLVLQTEFIENYWDIYRDQHCLVMPRRYGGLCLPVNEALGAGMPSIMPDIDPNNTWLPKDWLVQAKEGKMFESNTTFRMYDTYPKPLAKRIDRMANEKDFYRGCVYAAHFLAEQNSWKELESLYTAVFEEVLDD